MSKRITTGLIIIILYTIIWIIGVVLNNLYFIGVGLVIAILIIAICAALDVEGFFDK